MKGLMFGGFVVLFAAAVCSAQMRSVTNLDLEKYRAERIRAETDLRENYAKLGFPSPEVRERREAESAKARAQLAESLRTQRIEEERIEAIREAARRESSYVRTQIVQQETQYPGYFWQYDIPFGWQLRRRQVYQQPGYFAGGQFWPTGPAVRPQVSRPPTWSRPK